MASEPIDPLQALSAALAVASDSQEQADLLAKLRESLEAHPSPIPILCTTLIGTVSGAGDSLLKRWVLDLLHFAICRSALSLEARTQLASQSLEVLAGLLSDSNPSTVKVVVQCFTTVYPLLFRHLCTNRARRHPWDVLTRVKGQILEFIWSPHTPSGIKFASIKFLQKVILVQTRGVSDPRLQNKNDPNLSMCPTDHPFIPVAALEAEGTKLLEGVVTTLFTSQNPDIISAILNSWATLAKLRPALVEFVISALATWTPAALAGLPASEIRSVDKSVRILLIHLSRVPQGAAFGAQIHAALSTQASRMEKAAMEERQRKNALEASRKRPPSASSGPEPPDSKRVKLEDGANLASASFLASFDFTTLPAALVTDLIVANLQAISEQALSSLVQGYLDRRAGPAALSTPAIAAPTPTPVPEPVSIRTPSVTPIPVPPPTAPSKSTTPPPNESTPVAGPSRSKSPPVEPVLVKEEPVDPLQMDIDEDDIDFDAEKLDGELGDQEAPGVNDLGLDNEMDLTLDVQELKLPPPKELSDTQADMLIRNSLVRIWDGAKDLSPHEILQDAAGGGAPAADLWMLLIIRLVTRFSVPASLEGEEEAQEDIDSLAVELYGHQDRLRQTLCEYIMADFSGRLRLATTWMNEEWYNDRIRSMVDQDWRPNYETWLNQIVAMHQTHLDAKDRSFSRFLLDLPAVPQDVMSLLREMCVEPDRREVGFFALREFVLQRPSLRGEAMIMLLELTTHPGMSLKHQHPANREFLLCFSHWAPGLDKVTRKAAINTVKQWTDTAPMGNMIRDFALQLLRRLQSRPGPNKKSADTSMNGDSHDEPMEDEEDGQLPPEEIIQTPYLPEQLELPAESGQINQHVELLFVLSTKVPEFLDEIFEAYGGMDESVQETIQTLITPLIRALGPSHGKLLTLLRTFPPRSASLALRVLNIFTEVGRPSAQLVALIKALTNERELDARFLIPIIAEMDKADILRYLPKVVSILNGKPEPKSLVRSVFSSIVATPPQSFGSVSSNLPRVRQSELLTPAELMVLLHESEKEIGLKSAMEAIGICFSMTEIFRSEILGVVMNQLVDEPVLPTLFLRTVIQAVSTYRSLVGFVSTTLLSRLITKKVWTNPHLWEGFIRCAKQIAPASFGALLQLPKEQLREIVDKQPTLKVELKEYVLKKAGNKARVPGFKDIFGDDDAPAPVAAAAAGGGGASNGAASPIATGIPGGSGSPVPSSSVDGTPPPVREDTPQVATPTPVAPAVETPAS